MRCVEKRHLRNSARVGAVQGADQLLVDLRLERTIVPGHDLRYASLLATMPSIKDEFVAAHTLRPIRLIVQGPVCSGKSALADELGRRLAIPVHRAADIATAAQQAGLALEPRESKPGAGGKAGGSGGRLTSVQMARCCRFVLNCVEARNRGWVLDGWPKSLRDARELCTDAPIEQDQGAMGTGVAAAKAVPGAAASGSKGKAAAVPATAATSLLDDVPNPHARSTRADMLPTALVSQPAGGVAGCSKMLFQGCKAAPSRVDGGGKPAVQVMLAATPATLDKHRMRAVAAARASGQLDAAPAHFSDEAYARRKLAYEALRQQDACALKCKVLAWAAAAARPAAFEAESGVSSPWADAHSL